MTHRIPGPSYCLALSVMYPSKCFNKYIGNILRVHPFSLRTLTNIKCLHIKVICKGLLCPVPLGSISFLVNTR